ncbi:hypothetical protein LZ554_006471 [Drepanopeziza brunnea f. sp. 'monogermtubi']|nr:hypothetical protein LZ554_006471 [Drepanopeziza brunnea f. sp. 'monogermtubi']
MSHVSSQVSADLIWEIVGAQNAFLVKRAQSGGVRFSRDPLNLVNLHSRKHAGFVNDKAVGIAPAVGEKGGVTLITKKANHAQKPGPGAIKTTFGGNKTTRKTYKGIVNTTVKSGYRSDLRAPAVARASAIRQSQRPKKDLPESKLRGTKAKKAAAEKDESALGVAVFKTNSSLAIAKLRILKIFGTFKTFETFQDLRDLQDLLTDICNAKQVSKQANSQKQQQQQLPISLSINPSIYLILTTSPNRKYGNQGRCRWCLGWNWTATVPPPQNLSLCVAADLSHISSPAKITGYLPKDDGAKAAFKDADIIVIPAGIPRKPGMTRDDLFNINAGIVKALIEIIAEVAPKAYILIISNPVNSTVPIAAEVLKAKGVFDAKRLFGVTTLDVVRAETFVAEIVGEKNPQNLTIPVVGGHSGETIVPLFSQLSSKIPEEKLAALVKRVQFGGDEVVAAKDGAGSATLSMAYAGYRFAEAVLKALSGEKGIVTPTFIHLEGVPGGDAIAKETGCDFFSVPVELGTSGAEKAQNPLTKLDEKEKVLLKACVEGLKGNIKKGVDFAHNPPQK